MSMKTLESAVLAELREVTGKRSLRLKDILEWSTGDVDVSEDESLFFLPRLKVNCVLMTSTLGKKISKK